MLVENEEVGGWGPFILIYYKISHSAPFNTKLLEYIEDFHFNKKDTTLILSEIADVTAAHIKVELQLSLNLILVCILK
jgi:hypothetical protein